MLNVPVPQSFSLIKYGYIATLLNQGNIYLGGLMCDNA